MGTQRVQMKEAFPWLIRWALRACTRDFHPALLLKSTQYKIFFFSPYHFNSFVPIAQQGGQAVVLGCLSLTNTAVNYFSLWFHP
jgi:hypothetical protein